MKETLYRTCTIEAPCKINLHLTIGDKRADGFHSLESLFAPLAFGDTIRFERTDKEGECHLSMNWEGPGEAILPEKNLVSRAVSLFRERTGYKKGLCICLEKRIPAGAGLGGGSSDAASTLLALNSLAGRPLSAEELSKTAALLGSDVPFFLAGGVAFVSGRGEIVEPVKFTPKLWVVLVKPPFSSDTAYAYRLLDHARHGKTREKSGKELSKEILFRVLEEDPGTWPFQNDFLPVLIGSTHSIGGEKKPNEAGYEDLLAVLRKEGASFAGLSGSGSCCFGIFNSKNTAERAEKKLAGAFLHPAGCNVQENFSIEQANFIKMTFFLARRANPVLK